MFWLIILIIVLLDRITKYYIISRFSFNDIFPVIKNVFFINVLQNTGAGFGLLQGSTPLLIWLSIIVLGVILYFYERFSRNRSYLICFGLIAGGIIGNLIDRYAYGFVLDFIDVRIWPVFNIADASMTIGLLWLLALAICSSKRNSKKSKKSRKTE